MPKRSKPKHTTASIVAAVKKRKGKLYLAAADLGITTQTLRNYARRWKEVRNAIHEAKGRMLDVAEDKLFQAIAKGEAWAICFFLKTQGKHRGYVERVEKRHGGDKTASPIKTEAVTGPEPCILDELPYELTKQIIQHIQKKRAEKEQEQRLLAGGANGVQPVAAAGGGQQ
jgi:hypothetical protein